MKKMYASLKKVCQNQKGQAFVEYGLIIILVALALGGAAYALSANGIVPKFTAIQNEITSVDVPDLN